MKKTAVFYFSGTGNNLYIVKKLQEGMEHVKIYPFHQLMETPQMAYEYERILYGGRNMHRVRNLRKGLPCSEYKDGRKTATVSRWMPAMYGMCAMVSEAGN